MSTFYADFSTLTDGHTGLISDPFSFNDTVVQLENGFDDVILSRGEVTTDITVIFVFYNSIQAWDLATYGPWRINFTSLFDFEVFGDGIGGILEGGIINCHNIGFRIAGGDSIVRNCWLRCDYSFQADDTIFEKCTIIGDFVVLEGMTTSFVDCFLSGVNDYPNGLASSYSFDHCATSYPINALATKSNCQEDWVGPKSPFMQIAELHDPSGNCNLVVNDGSVVWRVNGSNIEIRSLTDLSLIHTHSGLTVGSMVESSGYVFVICNDGTIKALNYSGGIVNILDSISIGSDYSPGSFHSAMVEFGNVDIMVVDKVTLSTHNYRISDILFDPYANTLTVSSSHVVTFANATADPLIVNCQQTGYLSIVDTAGRLSIVYSNSVFKTDTNLISANSAVAFLNSAATGKVAVGRSDTTLTLYDLTTGTTLSNPVSYSPEALTLCGPITHDVVSKLFYLVGKIGSNFYLYRMYWDRTTFQIYDKVPLLTPISGEVPFAVNVSHNFITVANTKGIYLLSKNDSLSNIPVWNALKAAFDYTTLSSGTTNPPQPGTLDATPFLFGEVRTGIGTGSINAVPPPVADFTSDVTSGFADLTVHFTDESTGTPTSWDWDFGDGSLHSPFQNPTHVYTVQGVYSVTLTATNSGGSDPITKTNYITVTAHADFIADENEGYVTLPVVFTDTSIGAPTSWDWDFGDGSLHSNLQNPSHSYTVPGIFTVTLLISGTGGSDTKIRSNYISVFPAIVTQQPAIGAYEFIFGSPEDPYVTGTGDDYLNFGGKSDPFRTLDRAMLVTDDATTHINGGHYDTYYLQLSHQYLDLDQLFIYTPVINHLVSYKTLDTGNIKDGYYNLPGFLANPADSSNIAMNAVGGSTQVYGVDYTVETGAILWKGLALDGFLSVGDTLRIIYKGVLQYRALNALTFHSHYSNIEKERSIFVSPGGSDSTVLGGDGTNTGGNGTLDLPYRTIDKALSVSDSSHDYIVAIAGEYPIFQPLDNRFLAVATDRTVSATGQVFIEDDFYPNDFRAFGTTLTGPIPWDFTYSGDSYVTSGGGFLSLTYDGSNTARADSTFQIVNNFEVQADLRSFVDPLKMLITSPDNTLYINYLDQTFTSGAITGGLAYSCYGAVDVTTALGGTTFITDYVSVTYENINNQSIPLAFLPGDCSSVALNIVGGTSQNFGEDFTLSNDSIVWDSSSSMTELDPGEVVRVIYEVGDTAVAPIRVSMALEGNRLTAQVFNQDAWKTVFRRDIPGNYVGPWTVSFVMDSTGPEHFSCLNGRGFVSGFLAVADEIESVDSRPFGAITERKNLVVFPDQAIGIITDSSFRNGYDGTRYRNRIDATGGTSSWSWPYSWSWQVTDGTVPPGVLFYDKQSYAWFDGTPTTPGNYAFTVQLSDPGSRDQSTTKDFFIKVL